MASTKPARQQKVAKRPPSLEEMARTALKWEAVAALGLADKVRAEGWGGLSAAETGRVGGLIGKWRRDPKRSLGQAAVK